METLDELATRHRTDKMSSMHNYTPVYERLFAPVRMDHVRIIEIGIAGGESLKVWRDYFPNGEIWGVDAEPAFCKHELGERVHCVNSFQEDLAKMTDLGRTVKPHIVIDDGGHFGAPQWASFEILWPLVEPGGIYCIEDLHTAYWPNRGSIMPRLHWLIDELNRSGRVEFAGTMDRRAEPGMDLESIEFTQSLVAIRKHQ